LENKTKFSITTGDINNNLLSPSPIRLGEIILIFNLINIINEPTRVTRNSSTLIDSILVSNSIFISSNDVHVNDHLATFVFRDNPQC